MCHLIYDPFGEGILLGIELTESVCVCDSNGWKIGSPTTPPKLTKLKRIWAVWFYFIFRHKNVNLSSIYANWRSFCISLENVLLPPPQFFHAQIPLLFCILIRIHGVIGTKDSQSWIPKHDTKRIYRKQQMWQRKCAFSCSCKNKISVHYINFQVIIHFKWTRLICTQIYECRLWQSVAEWSMAVRSNMPIECEEKSSNSTQLINCQ